MMLILVEGPDGSGKSSLVSQLHHYLGWPIKKYTNHVTANEAVGVTMRHLFSSFSAPEIIDRCHFPSNLIYGKIINGYTHPEPIRNWYLNDVQKRLKDLNTIVIYLSADKDILASRITPDDYMNETYLKDLKDAYDNWYYNQLTVSSFRIDTSNISKKETFEVALEKIIQVCGRRGLNESF